MLGVTADNASNNDTMVTHLANIIESFVGSAGQVWCFLHVVALTTKSLICVFDPPESTSTVDADLDNAEAELRDLAANIEQEDFEAQLEQVMNEVTEKTDAVRESLSAAFRSAARGARADQVLAAALKPYGRRTRANAKRLAVRR